MALTKTEVRNGRLGQFIDQFIDVALGTYASNGIAVDPALFGFRELIACMVVGGNAALAGYNVIFDSTNQKLVVGRSPGFTPAGSLSAPTFTGTANAGTAGIVNDDDDAATKGHPLYVVRNSGIMASTPVAEGSATGVLKDSDTAAADGVQIYVVIDDAEYLPGFQLAHLEFVSPTNAHGTCTVFNGGPTLLIEDDDAAATNGFQTISQPCRRRPDSYPGYDRSGI